MAVWLTFVSLNSLPFVLVLASNLVSSKAVPHQGNGWVPLAMLGFGLAFLFHGRSLAREEGKSLVDFLTRTLRAEVVRSG